MATIQLISRLTPRFTRFRRNKPQTNCSNPLNRGFTLIEILIVTGLSTMLLLTISAMFMTFLTSSANTNIRRTLNREGEFAINQVEFMLRNARSITCNDNNIVIGLYDEDTSALVDNTLRLSNSDQRLLTATDSETNYLISESVKIADGSTDFFSCTPAGDKMFVDITLVLQKLNDAQEEIGNPEIYATSVQVRN